MVQDTNFICPRIYNACRLCKIRGNQLNKIDQQISTKIYECTTLKIISTKETKAFICDGCKAKIDEHYQFKMQCIRNVNLQRFNTGANAAVGTAAGISLGPVASGSNSAGGGGAAEANGAALAATAPATATSPTSSSSAVPEATPGSSSASTSSSSKVN